jgi:hypothetical protein
MTASQNGLDLWNARNFLRVYFLSQFRHVFRSW